MRQTSAEIYDQIHKSGLLSKRRLLVYRALSIRHHQIVDYQISPQNHGMTAHEMRQYAEQFMNVSQRVAEHLPKRLSELEVMGCVDTIGERKCRVTGNVCTVWDVNGSLPNPELLKEKKLAKKAKPFSEALFDLINAHVKLGLSKPDLVAKMKYATINCEKS